MYPAHPHEHAAHHRERQPVDEPAEAQHPEHDLHQAGHHHDRERLCHAVRVGTDDHRREDGHDRARPGDHRSGAAEHSSEQADRDRAVERRHRPEPGQHAEPERHRHHHHRRNDAAEHVPLEITQSVRPPTVAAHGAGIIPCLPRSCKTHVVEAWRRFHLLVILSREHFSHSRKSENNSLGALPAGLPMGDAVAKIPRLARFLLWHGYPITTATAEEDYHEQARRFRDSRDDRADAGASPADRPVSDRYSQVQEERHLWMRGRGRGARRPAGGSPHLARNVDQRRRDRRPCRHRGPGRPGGRRRAAARRHHRAGRWRRDREPPRLSGGDQRQRRR